MKASTRTFWRGFWKGWTDPRVWAWLYPAIAALDIWAFVDEPSGWRWVILAFAVLFLVETGWTWREFAEQRMRRRYVTVRITTDMDAFNAALWKAHLDQHRKDAP